jgi:hypothetical protein
MKSKMGKTKVMLSLYQESMIAFMIIFGAHTMQLTSNKIV